MKSLLALVLCISICLCGCMMQPDTQNTQFTTQSTTTGIQTDPTDADDIVYDLPLVAVSTPMITEITAAEDGTCIFTYSVQDIMLTMDDPVVAEIVTDDFLHRNDLSVTAQSVLDAAKAAYTGQDGWTPYSFVLLYNPMRLDQSVLSFYGSEIIDNGGPRSTSTNVSVSYDLLTGKALTLSDILVSGYAAEELVNKILASISDLSEQGVLFTDYEYIISDLFSTNTPMERWFFTRNGLCFFFTPYEIAPYNAGTVIAEVPYAELVGLLKDEYFPAEEISYNGSLALQEATQADMNAYQRITEVILDPDGTEYVIVPHGTAVNVRLDMRASTDDAVPGYTVYAATGLTEGDAVMLQLTKDQLSGITVSYNSISNESLNP